MSENNLVINISDSETEDSSHYESDNLTFSTVSTIKNATNPIITNNSNILPDIMTISSEDKIKKYLSFSMDDNIQNGWDDNAIKTINNWNKLFKEQSFIYQWILDNNQKISNKLNIISVISSTSLSIFSAFKLWLGDNSTFRISSDIVMIIFNFIIAIITAQSKRYLDDNRNEKIKIYIDEVNDFIGEISAQLLKSPNYRLNADEFFKKNNEKYTKLIINAPNLSINEIIIGREKYKIFNELFNE